MSSCNPQQVQNSQTQGGRLPEIHLKVMRHVFETTAKELRLYVYDQVVVAWVVFTPQYVTWRCLRHILLVCTLYEEGWVGCIAT